MVFVKYLFVNNRDFFNVCFVFEKYRYKIKKCKTDFNLTFVYVILYLVSIVLTFTVHRLL